MDENNNRSRKIAVITVIAVFAVLAAGLAVWGVLFYLRSDGGSDLLKPGETLPLIDLINAEPGEDTAAEETVSAKVRLAVIKVNPDGSRNLVCGVMESEIKGTKKDPPTVFQAACEIFEENSVQYTVDESVGGHFTSIKSQKEISENGVVSLWIPRLNGEELEGLASETAVNDGDYIVYYLETWIVDDDGAEAVGTDT